MKIKNITHEPFSGKVYNFHCLPDEMYMSEGMLVHNCYKGSTASSGRNMSFETFKNIIDKMPFLTQIAIGADAKGTANPDLFKMMQYARSKSIPPNLTIADVSDDVAKELASVAGAVAVSVYKHAGFDIAFDSVKRLADAGQKNINLHYMISKKTIVDAYNVVDSLQSDARLSSVGSIVFLSLKQKNRGEKHEYCTQDEYSKLVQYCLDKGVSFGFDSCSAPIFLESVKDHPNFANFKQHSEDCESTLFSSYISVTGELFPCSFTENWSEGSWDTGIDVVNATDFIKDVWFNPRVNEFRKALISNTDSLGCRNCPAYTICGKSGYVLTNQNGKYEKQIEVQVI